MKRFKRLISLLVIMSMLLSTAALTACDQFLPDRLSDKKHSRDRDDDDDEDETEESEESEETEETEESSEVSIETTEPTSETEIPTEPIQTETAPTETDPTEESSVRPPKPTRPVEATATPTPAVTGEPSPTEEPSVRPTEEPTSAPTGEPASDPVTDPVIYGVSGYFSRDNDGCYISYMSMYMDEDLSAEYVKLGERFDEINKQFSISHIEDRMNEVRASFDFYSWGCYQDMVIKRCDKQAVSYVNIYDYYGYGNYDTQYESYEYETFNIDPVTGEDIRLEDVVSDMNGVAGVALKYFDYIKETDTFVNLVNNGTIKWVLEPQGVTFILDEFRTTVLFSEAPDCFTEKFTPSGFYALSERDMADGGLIVFDKDDDGKRETLRIDPVRDEYNAIGSFYVSYNDFDRYVVDDIWCYDYEPYIIRNGDQTYLYLMVHTELLTTTFIFGFHEGGIYLIDQEDYDFTGHYVEIPNPYYGTYVDSEFYTIPTQLVTPARMCRSAYTYLLGTYSYYDPVKIGNDGIPVAEIDLSFAAFNLPPLEVVSDFNAIDAETKETVTIEAGNKLKVGYLDIDDGLVIVSDENGKMYYIECDG